MEVTQELYERQLENELRQITGGISDYHINIENQKAKRNYGQTKPGSWIIEQCFPKLKAAIEARIDEGLTAKAGRHNFVVNYLHPLEPDVIAYITLRILLDCAAFGISRRVAVAQKIGTAVKEELEHLSMRTQNPKAYAYWTQRAREATHGTTKKRCIDKLRAISDLSAFQNIKDEELIYIGLACIEDAKDSCGVIIESTVRRGKKTQDFIELSPFFIEKAEEFNRHCENLWPWNDPMIVPPTPWTGAFGGGYVGELRRRTKLIRTSNRKYLEDIHLNRDKFGLVFNALNAIQNTPWRINRRVFEVMDEAWSRESRTKYGLPSLTPQPLPPPPIGKDGDEKLAQQYAFKVQEIRDGNKINEGHRLVFSKILGTAWLFIDEKAIWFPHNLDWRGRIYPISRYLTPQGSEISQSLLEFAEGKPLGTQQAVGWLAVHGANCYGVDKVSFEDRMAWVQENKQNIRETVENPLDGNLWWTGADSPWLFLAWCFDWVGYLTNGLAHVSHLSVAMDGSCNGLQNFTAMLRDPETARAVNLAPASKPNDIYQQVADIVATRVKELGATRNEDDATLHELATMRTNLEINAAKKVQAIRKRYEDLRDKIGRKALKSEEYSRYKSLKAKLDEEKAYTGELWNVLTARWLEGLISRNLVKQPVMTYPYAVSEFGVKKQLTKKLQELCRADKMGDFPYEHCSKAAFMLKNIVFRTVREEVRAAARAMDWLKSVAEMISVHNKPISWYSPIGLLVVQEYKMVKEKRIDTVVGSTRVQHVIAQAGDSVDGHAQANAIAPNFVHSCDASHLMMTVNACIQKRVIDFHMIHDSYGTHAANASVLAQTLREEFIKMYSGNALQKFLDDLSHFLPAEALVGINVPPSQGDFDLKQVQNSRYFFA